MFTADQLVAHCCGDYLLQSQWMADHKGRRHVAALVHAVTYGLPFLLVCPSLVAWLVIVLTHFAIDRWRLARSLVWLKNWLGDPAYWRRGPLPPQTATGYPDRVPPWLAVWLLIVVDNLAHVVINGLALQYL